MASREFPVRADKADTLDTQTDCSVLWESHGVLLCEFPPQLQGVMTINNESCMLTLKRLRNNTTTTKKLYIKMVRVQDPIET